jgi:hypothetical protein
VDGQVYHFGARGLYNGGLLLGDRETGSYWQHVSGNCVHGALKGHQLTIFPLVHMNVGQALGAYSGVQIALSSLSFRQRAIIRAQEGVLDLLGNRLPPGFQLTMGKEDRRLPRMERGLAVWTACTQRFYPTATLRARGNALIDADEKLSALDGRRVLVYVDPVSDAPTCLYTDAAQWSWQGGALALDTGESVLGGALYDPQGAPRATDRPMQSVTCWYGYAFTFPGGEIYEG